MKTIKILASGMLLIIFMFIIGLLSYWDYKADLIVIDIYIAWLCGLASFPVLVWIYEFGKNK